MVEERNLLSRYNLSKFNGIKKQSMTNMKTLTLNSLKAPFFWGGVGRGGGGGVSITKQEFFKFFNDS